MDIIRELNHLLNSVKFRENFDDELQERAAGRLTCAVKVDKAFCYCSQ